MTKCASPPDRLMNGFFRIFEFVSRIHLTFSIMKYTIAINESLSSFLSNSLSFLDLIAFFRQILVLLL